MPRRAPRPPNPARPGDRHRHAHGRHDRHRPADFAAFVGRQLDPERDRWQQPRRVLRALGLRPGAVVADIGAGPGYFTLTLARAVGPRGRVYAVDPEPRNLEILRDRLTKSGVRNVTPVLGRGDDPHLPPGVCDAVLIVDTYHHFPDGPDFLRRAARLLRRHGRIAAIDFEKRETPVGPPVEHRIAREAFLRDARRAGLTLAAEHRFLPYQYFVVLRPRTRRAATETRSRSDGASPPSTPRRSTVARRQ